MASWSSSSLHSWDAAIYLLYIHIYIISIYIIYSVNPHITWVKAASAQDQHIIIRPAGEVITAMLHPEDSRSTVVRNKSSSTWCQSAYKGPYLLFTSLKSDLQTVKPSSSTWQQSPQSHRFADLRGSHSFVQPQMQPEACWNGALALPLALMHPIPHLPDTPSLQVEAEANP